MKVDSILRQGRSLLPKPVAVIIVGLACAISFGQSENGAVIEIIGNGEPLAPADEAQRGPSCTDAPTCVPQQADTVGYFFDATGMASYMLRYQVDSTCPPPREMLTEIIIDGALDSNYSVFTNATSPVTIVVSGDGFFFPDGVVEIEVRFTDVDNGATSSCFTTLTGQCGASPSCSAPNMIEVRPFGDTAMLEFEYEPGCAPFPSDIEHSHIRDATDIIFETIAFGVTQSTTLTSGPFVDLLPGESTFFTFKLQDRGSGATAECTTEVRACDTPVICSLDNDISYMNGPMRVYDVMPGDTLDVLEVCAESACGGAARVEMFARPPFMDPAGHRKSAEGEAACISTKSDDVVESGYAEGTYWAKFRCTDLLTGDVQELKVGYNYTGLEPEPDPVVRCTENEAESPNDGFGDATIIEAALCVDDGGIGLFGTLDIPIFINGDVDFFRIEGLNPSRPYTATIVAGSNGQLGLTDTMLGWLASEGVVIVADDNSGPRGVYSKIEFVADQAGSATLAVTGHGDDDFNGLMDPAMEYELYGYGDYMLLIRTLEEDAGEMPLERQADLNGDGIVDTGDLGMLIGLFGATN